MTRIRALRARLAAIGAPPAAGHLRVLLLELIDGDAAMTRELAELVALGHANLKHGRARLTMRELRTRTRGRWEVTVVFSQTVKTSTNTVPVSVR